MHVAWAFSVLGLASAAVRLGWLRLARQYRFFFGYLLLNVISGCTLFAMGSPRSESYLITWELFEPFKQVMLMLAVAEVYGALVGQYPRIGRVAAWLLIVASAVAAIVCAGTAAPELGSLIWSGPVLRTLFLTHRWLSTIALGTLCLSLGFFSFYRRPIASNVKRHTLLMVVYCGGNAAAFLAVNLWPRQTIQWASVAELYVSALCGFAWVLAFSASGETVMNTGPSSSIEELDEARRKQQDLLDEVGGIQPLG